MGSVRSLSLSESEELKPKLWVKKFPVGEWKDINVGKLVCYTAERAEEERLQTPRSKEKMAKARQSIDGQSSYMADT